MLTKFKKFGVAAAVAAALGASGAAQAVIQGEPGDALLIPYAITTGLGKINTMVGIINASPSQVALDQFPTLTASAKYNADGTARCAGKLHWYFFDITSNEVVDGQLSVTCEDFVPFDFAAITTNLPSAQNKPGYLVITDNDATTTKASGKILYAAAYQIRGNWATQAYIPVIPVIDNGTSTSEVVHNGAFLKNVNPVTAGMVLPVYNTQQGYFSLRYYLGASPVGTTDFVLWFPENSTKRSVQSILVYDGNEVSFSAQTSIPNELNILEVSPTATGKAPYTGKIVDGLADTGFVLFNVKDGVDMTATPTPTPVSRGGFAFSLVGVAGSTQEQIQTELAQERGVK